MDSTLQALRESIARFTEREVAPFAQEADTHDRMPQRWVAQLVALGAFTAGMPEPDGMGLIGECVALREIARASGSLAVDAAQRMLAVRALAGASGHGPATVADSLSSGSGAVAVSRGLHASGGPLGRAFGDTPAAVTVLLPSCDDAAGPARVLTEARAAERIGYDGLRGLAAFDLDGTSGDPLGPQVSVSVMAADRILLAAVAAGLARGVLDHAVAYAKERKQFGRPIAAFGEMQALLAKALARSASADAVVLHAAREFDQGAHDAEAATLAFVHASHAAVRTAERAQHVHGGYGHMREYVVGRYVRDARTLRSLGGPAPIVDKFLAKSLGLVEQNQNHNQLAGTQ